MLLRNLSLLGTDPLAFLRLILEISLALVIAITVHEFSHALAAHRLGDSTAKLQGRLSLNPLVHLDVLGTILLFLVGFGWGKPVPVDYYRLRGGARWGMATVSLAGPLAGLFTAGLIGLGLRLAQWPLSDALFWVFFFNILLSLFNLIPLAPLDGFHVVHGLLPRQMAYSFSRLAYYGPLLLLLVIFLDSFTRLGLLWRVLSPGMNFFSLLFLGERLI